MLDYIETTKHLITKDKPFLGYLQKQDYLVYGWQKYFIEGCRNMEIRYNPSMQIIRLKGSPLYYYQGQNFTYSKKIFVESIKYLEDILHIGLFESDLDVLESGIIMEVDRKPKYIISGHQAGKGLSMRLNEKDKGNIRYYSDKLTTLKLYNAGANIQHKQSIPMKEIIKKSGWNPEGNFLKFEAHYSKPHISLNNGRNILLSEIFSPSWEDRLKEDLYNQYQRLEPMRSIEMPTSKKDLSSGEIILLTLAEQACNEGKDLKELLYNKINSIPESVLNHEDKKKRKQKINIMLGKVGKSSKSEYDISDLLESSLYKKE